MKRVPVLLRLTMLFHLCVAIKKEFTVEPTATAIFKGTNGKEGVVEPPSDFPCLDCTSSTCINCCSLAIEFNVCPIRGLLDPIDGDACETVSSQFTTVCSEGVVDICVCPSPSPRSSISYSVAEISTPPVLLASTPSALLSDSMQTFATPDPSNML
ncbi:unnamed protein product [Orchesella dallaii]|uniref:Uncharacterized protein n=1 Tax=Orchesella dallaii TaxID=48710 RepID=A0ABP1QJJ4_9HEXA